MSHICSALIWKNVMFPPFSVVRNIAHVCGTGWCELHLFCLSGSEVMMGGKTVHMHEI